jgi:hypothetical protein
MSQTLSNSDGRLIWYTTDEYGKDSPLAFFEQGQTMSGNRVVFAISGKCLRFYDNNWICDTTGQLRMVRGQ